MLCNIIKLQRFRVIRVKTGDNQCGSAQKVRMRKVRLEMEEIRNCIEEFIKCGEKILAIIASNPKDKEKMIKMKVRPVIVKDKLVYQAESFIGTKAFHENIEETRLADFVCDKLENFKQFEMDTQTMKVTALISKKGKVTLKKKRKENVELLEEEKIRHNKKKQYVLPADEIIPFLVDLGVQTKEGKIVNTRYDKFRQINRYLEFVKDIIPSLPKDRTLTIIDFGCGKSYLTFALYYYLKIVNHFDIRVIGLDLKEDVIDKCNLLSKKYGYDGLSFHVGDISTYEGVDEVDMVVTLHACDVATDYALEKAIKWNAKVIFSVPCCQHEINKQIQCEELDSILKYGLIKERMSALITDAIRANILEEQGYETQILEFIDMEHTPKNILIRAVKRSGIAYQPGAVSKKKGQTKQMDSLDKLQELLHIEPTLRHLLEQK